jgi:hypothetical protein
MKNLSKYVKTSDDFHPNCEGDTVNVAALRCGTSRWIVVVWGDDDFGMELTDLTCAQAKEMYDKINSTSQTNVTWLTGKGFVRA